MLVDVLTRPLHEWRLSVLLLQHGLIGQRGELFGEKCEQSHRRIVFVRWDEWSFLPCFANLAVKSHSVPLQFPAHFCALRFGWGVTQHLADAQVSDDLC